MKWKTNGVQTYQLRVITEVTLYQQIFGEIEDKNHFSFEIPDYYYGDVLSREGKEKAIKESELLNNIKKDFYMFLDRKEEKTVFLFIKKDLPQEKLEKIVDEYYNSDYYSIHRLLEGGLTE